MTTATEPSKSSGEGALFHEYLAHSWTAGYGRPSFGRRLEFLLSHVDRQPRSGTAWLDAGCGSGVVARELQKRGAVVTAVDASPAMIAAATAETPPGAIAFQLIETIERLNIPAGSQEGVICSSVLEYVSSPRAALAEMRRVLKPHGTLIASVPNTWSGIRLAQQAVRSVARVFGLHPYRYLEVSKHCYSRRGFVRLLESEGFRVEIISSFSPVAPRLVSLLGAGALWVAVASRTDRTSPLNSSV